MKKQMKVPVIWLSVLALTAGVAGCSSKQQGETTASPTVKPTATATADSMATSLNISWVGALARGKIENNNFVQKQLESKFNVKLTNKQIDVNNTEQVNLMLASGGLTDVAYMISQDINKLHVNGMTRTIPKAMIQKYAPNYAKMLDDNPPGWKLSLASGKTDEYLALNGIGLTASGLLWGQVYRLDWMEKLGIKPKGNPVAIGTSDGRERVFFTTEAFTLEEEEQLFAAMVNRDPDGNGKKDTYAFSPNNGSLLWWAANYLGAFGLGSGNNLEENGKLVEYNISEKYKAFLKQMADWYKKGYIDPEFPTLDRNKGYEKFATGKIGSALSQYAEAGLKPGATMQRPPGNLITKDPNVKILLTPPPIGPNGQQGAAAYTPASDYTSSYLVIKKDVSDEKLIRILQIFDYINFDKEGLVMSRYGKEGTDFQWEGTPYKSAITPINEAAKNPEQAGLGYYNHQLNTIDIMTYTTPQDVMKLVNDYFFNKDKGMKLLLRPYKFDLFKETKYGDLNTKNGAKLETVRSEYTLQAITGEINIDSTWNSYVEKWRSNGGNELMAELEKAPKVSDILSRNK
ncbi:ABC transporter substrate-binding protein [Paenibacillus koleovorans]|uniref:ABC transporter substrate-binding protein n=1 Tax=Paenibacillus koleovorans TaxID=121608 RepID=UPI000FD95DD5|nr:ABC transporter substrate-binding protein [Paenibacillus koleovorans]